jgi:hypothetical protein
MSPVIIILACYSVVVTVLFIFSTPSIICGVCACACRAAQAASQFVMGACYRVVHARSAMEPLVASMERVPEVADSDI